MGLDMTLGAARNIRLWTNSEYKQERDYKNILEALDVEESVIDQDYKSIQVSLGLVSWRKANQIHDWFVENVQDGEDDCGEYQVSREQLAELASLCAEVIKHPNQAEDLLPTTDGFFFGNTEYNDYYFEQVESTRARLVEVLTSETLKDYDFYYSSSW